MAEARLFVCSSCGHSIESWSDGNPYYIDDAGEKQHAYHPDERVAQCIGNDEPHLCMSCGHEVDVDSRDPIDSCPKCKDRSLVLTWELEGRACPTCKKGTLGADPDYHCVS